jgi:hypothetical protein
MFQKRPESLARNCLASKIIKPIACLFVQASVFSSRAAESDAKALEVKASGV